MNPRWLARAQLFELPGPPCKRGHDLSREGVYRRSIWRNGKPYPVESCRRCRIEDVTNCLRRKNRKPRKMKKAA